MTNITDKCIDTNDYNSLQLIQIFITPVGLNHIIQTMEESVDQANICFEYYYHLFC